MEYKLLFMAITMNNTAAITLIQTAQWLNNELNQSLSAIDLTGQQLKILSILAESENHQALVNDIKANMFTPMSNVSRLLNKLMEKELIQKVRGSQDQRKVSIHLTKSGMTALCEGKKIMDETLAIMNRLSEPQQQTLTTLLEQLTANT